MRPRGRPTPDDAPAHVVRSIEEGVSDAVWRGYDSVACYQGGSHWQTVEVHPEGLKVYQGLRDDDPDLDRALKRGFSRGIDLLACRNRPEPLAIQIGPDEGHRASVPDEAIAPLENRKGSESRPYVPDDVDVSEMGDTPAAATEKTGRAMGAATLPKSKSGKQPRGRGRNRKGGTPGEIRRFARQARR